MKTFRPGLPPIFTDEDATPSATPNRVFTPAEKAAGADKPFLSPADAIAAADARHAASQPPQPQPPAPAAPATPAPVPTPPPQQIIPPVTPKPLVDNNAPAPVVPNITDNISGHIQPPASTDPLVLTPAEEAELDALLAKRDHKPTT
jgi:hypothetical protein